MWLDPHERTQQYGWSGDRQVAGSSDPERCIDAERNAGDTAMLAARTPAPPMMPQNQGMGPALIVKTNRMPVGNPKPIRKPAGATTRTQRPARTMRSAPSRPNTIGSQNGNANK